MLALLSIAASGTAIILLIIVSGFGVRYLVAVKGIIDAGWGAKFAGILNAPRMVGGLVPFILLPKIVLATKVRFFSLPLSRLGTLYLISCCWGALIVLGQGKYVSGLDYILRVLNGYVGFFMFQVFFNDRQSFKKLLIAVLICGLFPMGMGLHAAITGKIWGEVRQTAGLVRNVAVYHDAMAIRMYAFLTLTGILLYWQYFKPNVYTTLLMLAYVGVCCIVIFKAYSKSAILIFIAWAFVWTACNKKFGILLLLPIVLISLNLALNNRIFEDTIQAFSKETAAWMGEMEERYRFSGRTILWGEVITAWKNKGIFLKLFGGQFIPAHNEYLRILMANGILGLSIYIFMYALIGVKVFFNMLRSATPLNVMALMLFVMLTIDSIGVHPGLYPVYQWHVWGFIALSLHGVSGLPDEAKEKNALYPQSHAVFTPQRPRSINYPVVE